jgi:hypothetical protein
MLRTLGRTTNTAAHCTRLENSTSRARNRPAFDDAGAARAAIRAPRSSVFAVVSSSARTRLPIAPRPHAPTVHVSAETRQSRCASYPPRPEIGHLTQYLHLSCRRMMAVSPANRWRHGVDEREIPMKKLAVRISAVSGGIVAMLLAGGANLKFR